MESIVDSVIDIRGLGLAFEREGRRTEVLRGLDLAIPRGAFIAIVGASGVGKSTLLRVLIGLAQASAGKVTLDTRSAQRQPVALVFQDSRLLPWRRVLGNAVLGAELHGVPRREAEGEARALLGRFGLASRVSVPWPCANVASRAMSSPAGWMPKDTRPQVRSRGTGRAATC